MCNRSTISPRAPYSRVGLATPTRSCSVRGLVDMPPTIGKAVFPDLIMYSLSTCTALNQKYPQPLTQVFRIAMNVMLFAGELVERSRDLQVPVYQVDTNKTNTGTAVVPRFNW